MMTSSPTLAQASYLFGRCQLRNPKDMAKALKIAGSRSPKPPRERGSTVLVVAAIAFFGFPPRERGSTRPDNLPHFGDRVSPARAGIDHTPAATAARRAQWELAVAQKIAGLLRRVT